MEFNAILDIAKRGEPIQEPMSLSERMCYQAIMFLIERCKLGKISDDAARRELQGIRQEYTRVSNIEQYSKQCAELWCRIEDASVVFAKERTIESAEKMYEVIYNMRLPEGRKNEA